MHNLLTCIHNTAKQELSQAHPVLLLLLLLFRIGKQGLAGRQLFFLLRFIRSRFFALFPPPVSIFLRYYLLLYALSCPLQLLQLLLLYLLLFLRSFPHPCCPGLMSLARLYFRSDGVDFDFCFVEEALEMQEAAFVLWREQQFAGQLRQSVVSHIALRLLLLNLLLLCPVLPFLFHSGDLRDEIYSCVEAVGEEHYFMRGRCPIEQRKKLVNSVTLFELDVEVWVVAEQEGIAGDGEGEHAVFAVQHHYYKSNLDQKQPPQNIHQSSTNINPSIFHSSLCYQLIDALYNITCKSMLKSFDFFRKIQTDQQLTSATGGLFTIIALVAASILILYSVQDFYTEQYYTFLAVQNDDSQTLPMRVDILFNRMPCNAMSIEFYDEMEYIESNLEKKLTLTNLPVDSEVGQPYQRDVDVEKQREQLQRNIEQGVRCRVKGVLPLPKTPGTLVFKPTANNNLILNLDDSLIDKARMVYRIETLSFGNGNATVDFPIAHKSKNIENYIKQLEGDFRSRQFIQNFQDEQRKMDYFNHLKIIPVVVEGENGKSTEGYRYSLRSSTVELTDDPFEGVMFMTEIEPINIIHRRHYPRLYDLVIEILAIVGGTVATLGIVNSLSHFLFGIK